jgi:hypothetical protein
MTNNETVDKSAFDPSINWTPALPARIVQGQLSLQNPLLRIINQLCPLNVESFDPVVAPLRLRACPTLLDFLQ